MGAPYRHACNAMSDRPAEHTTRVPVERDMDLRVSSDLESDKSKYQQDSSIRWTKAWKESKQREAWPED